MTKAFFDTNVFVYGRLEEKSEKSEIAASLIDSPAIIAVSTQVLIEFANVALRFGWNPTLIAEELAFISAAADETVTTDLSVIDRAVQIVSDAKIGWFDALIVAAAMWAECETLVTEDLNDGQVIAGVRIVNPFV